MLDDDSKAETVQLSEPFYIENILKSLSEASQDSRASDEDKQRLLIIGSQALYQAQHSRRDEFPTLYQYVEQLDTKSQLHTLRLLESCKWLGTLLFHFDDGSNCEQIHSFFFENSITKDSLEQQFVSEDIEVQDVRRAGSTLGDSYGATTRQY